MRAEAVALMLRNDSTRMQSGQGQHMRGFTLIELAVVLGVIGVLASLAGPNINRMLLNIRNKGATTDIAGLMRMARSMAMQENRPFALIIRDGSAANTRAALVRCPNGTTAAYNFNNITTPMIDTGAGYPAGFSPVRIAEIGKDIGIGGAGLGSAGILTMYRPYTAIPRTAGCSFCAGGNGAILFKSDGSLTLTNGAPYGSVTVSIAASWPTPSAAEMYTITVMGLTGEVRVWH